METDSGGMTEKLQGQVKPCCPQNTVPGCGQSTHPESARLKRPRGWPLRRSIRTTENSAWCREDPGLCQRWTSPHTLAHPGPEPPGRTSAFRMSSGMFSEEQRKNWAEERRDRPWGTPWHFRTPLALPQGPPPLTSPLQKQYIMATKNPCGERGRGQGRKAGGSAPPPGRASARAPGRS